VALDTLTRVISYDVAAVQRHRAVIVECLRDADVSIRRRALDLVYALVNAENVRPLTKELLNYLVRERGPVLPEIVLWVEGAAVAAATRVVLSALRRAVTCGAAGCAFSRLIPCV
jgi:hypothetical protein